MSLPPLSLVDAINTRRSVRAFLPKPVPEHVLIEILKLAARSPSGTNIQPWFVTVVTGDRKIRLTRALLAAHAANEPGDEEYSYYPPTWREPYIGRRRKIGFDMYGLLGIGKADKDKMHAQSGRNYEFFGAPVGVFFTIDRDMGKGSWLDFGMFAENVMLAARAFGLDTCIQAAFLKYHRIIEDILDFPGHQQLVTGMSLGYADLNAPVNQLQTVREPVENFTRFLS
jgi:nitroreductase